MENYGQRVELIKKIQKKTDSILISLIYNTSNTRFRTQLASDILDSLNLLLKSIPNNLKRKKISLFLHSQGGFLDVVTSFVYMLRKKFETFDVIIPEIAHSAATILSLGADNILMSYYSSLSPFDPQLSLKTQSGTIGASTEDIKGYYSLMLEFFKDDMAKVQAFNMLANRFPPEVLGNMERVQKQVRMVATKMLGYHNTPEEEIEAVIDKFQKEFYSHQYRIHFDDAKKLGLKVSLMDDRLESLCIELLALYKSNFGTQADLEIEIPEEKNSVEIVINRSYLESLYSSFSYKTKYRIFKDKKVEVEELGWLSNEFIKSTKEKSDEN